MCEQPAKFWWSPSSYYANVNSNFLWLDKFSYVFAKDLAFHPHAQTQRSYLLLCSVNCDLSKSKLKNKLEMGSSFPKVRSAWHKYVLESFCSSYDFITPRRMFLRKKKVLERECWLEPTTIYSIRINYLKYKDMFSTMKERHLYYTFLVIWLCDHIYLYRYYFRTISMWESIRWLSIWDVSVIEL